MNLVADNIWMPGNVHTLDSPACLKIKTYMRLTKKNENENENVK